MGWGTGGRRPERGDANAASAGQGDGGIVEAAASRRSPKPGYPGLSLKGRALKLLAQREHSRLELTRKLAPHAESVDQVQSVLDELEQRGFLSSQRFAESLVHRRAPRFGLRRIKQELDTHRLDAAVAGPVLQGLRDTERERALVAWQKRFGEPAPDAEGRGRQHRFLAQRGFAGDAIHWVLRQAAQSSDGPRHEWDRCSAEDPLGGVDEPGSAF